MLFKMQHKYMPSQSTVFTDADAPDWLTGVKTVPGSTMDNRWFWKDYVLTLSPGKSVQIDFQIITRLE